MPRTPTLGTPLPERCVFCDRPFPAATIHDFKFDDARTPFDYAVCANHLTLLAMLRLPHADVLKLRLLARGDVFNIHDDFYDEKGNALQPRG
jgi:hypothetical protein